MSQWLWEGNTKTKFSVSFKLWDFLDTYSDTVQGAPVLCIVFHSSRFCQEPCGRGGTGKFMWHCRLSPTLPCTSSGGSGRSVTQRCKAAEHSSSLQVPAAPLLPSTADGNRNYFRYNNKWGSSWDWTVTSPTQTPGSWEKEEGHTKHHQIFPVTQGPLCN